MPASLRATTKMTTATRTTTVATWNTIESEAPPMAPPRPPHAASSATTGYHPYGGVRVLVGSAVFKTVEAGVPRLAGSIPVRLRYQPKRCGGSTNHERLSRPESPEFYRTSNDSDLEIPLSAPRARTRSSTSRVLTPCKYAPSPPRTTPGRPCAGVPAATGRKTQPAAWGSATPSHRPWSPAPGVDAVALPRPVRVVRCVLSRKPLAWVSLTTARCR
jgi:hypothetical protein